MGLPYFEGKPVPLKAAKVNGAKGEGSCCHSTFVRIHVSRLQSFIEGNETIAGFCKKCQVSFSRMLQHTSAFSDLALPSAGLLIKSSSLSRGLTRTLECRGARSSIMGLDWPQVCFAACLMVMPACKSVRFLIFFHSFLDYASLID